MTRLVVVETFTDPLDALGGVRLQVAEHRAAAARDVLARFARGEFAQALAEESGVPESRCPACGSTDLRYMRAASSTILLLATFGLSSVIFPPRIDGRQCNSCGKRFGVEDA